MMEAELVATASTAREGGFETRRYEQEGSVCFHDNDGGQNAIACMGWQTASWATHPAGDGFPFPDRGRGQASRERRRWWIWGD